MEASLCSEPKSGKARFENVEMIDFPQKPSQIRFANPRYAILLPLQVLNIS